MMTVLWQQFSASFIWQSYFPLLAGVGIILTLMTSLAAWKYFARNRVFYYLLTLLYLLSSTIVILTNNWFLFLFGWELVTLTTALMLAWSSWRLVRQYFIIQFFGSSILLLAALTAISFGYNKIGIINSNWLQLLLILGVAMKSGLFLFHFWLPPIHAEAPAPVSAILSGWVVKLGYIFLLKIIPITTGNKFLYLLGLLMIIYAGWQAFRSADLKIMLAYSTISQLGLIALAIGTGGRYAFAGAVLQIIGHGFAKTTLFISSGIWQQEYGSRIIYDFKNAVFRRPLTSAATLLSFLSLSGLVFTAGYNSKYLIKSAQIGDNFAGLLFFGLGLLSFLYSFRIIYWFFIKNQNYHNFKKNLLFKNNNYSYYFSDLAALLVGSLVLIIAAFWPEMPGDSLAFLAAKDFHLLIGLRDNLIYLVIVGYLLISQTGFIVQPRTQLSLENYLQSFLNFSYSISRKSIIFDTERIFESFFYRAIYNSAHKLYKFVYQDFTMQLLWIPIFLTIILFWQQLYALF
jgi:NADH-quinone oxidoreductase subunit M